MTRTFCGDGTPPEIPAHLPRVSKVRVYPDRRLLIGGAGSWTRYAMLDRYLPPGDVSAIALELPERLHCLVREIRGIDELVVIVAGWSESEGRCVGFAFELGDRFRPHRLDRGVTAVPVANPRAPRYDRLCALWRAAVDGEEMERFHAELFRNQRWSYAQGILRRGVHLSTELDIATVDQQHGARMVTEAAEAQAV